MFLADLSAQDAAVIIGATGALVVAVLAPLLKVIVDVRKQTSETNVGINNRPKAEGTLRDVVDKISARIEQLEESSEIHHNANSRRIDRVTIAVDAQTRKMDRLTDAIGGVNGRIDRIEGKKP